MAGETKPGRPGKEELIKRAKKPSGNALHFHPFYRGKMQTLPKCAAGGFDEFSIWHSPSLAAPWRGIQADPELIYVSHGRRR